MEKEWRGSTVDGTAARALLIGLVVIRGSYCDRYHKSARLYVKPIRLVRTYARKTSVCNDVLPSINVPRASLRLPAQH
jgi:hypothetical protein